MSIFWPLIASVLLLLASSSTVTAQPSQPTFLTKITVKHDNWPTETSWSLSRHPTLTLLLYQLPGDVYVQGQTVVQTALLPPGDYQFVINDPSDDGICCNFGQGYYEIQVGNQKIHRDGRFFSQEIIDFTIESNGALVNPTPQGQAGVPQSTPKIEYYLTVEYGPQPWNTHVKVQLMEPRTEKLLWPAGSYPPNGFRMEALKDITGGQEYRLVLEDESGRGMGGGFADVGLYVNDVWCQDLIFIKGDDPNFHKKIRERFWVPTDSEVQSRCCTGGTC